MYVCWLSDENPSNVQEAGGIHGSSIINRCRKSVLIDYGQREKNHWVSADL